MGTYPTGLGPETVKRIGGVERHLYGSTSYIGKMKHVNINSTNQLKTEEGHGWCSIMYYYYYL